MAVIKTTHQPSGTDTDGTRLVSHLTVEVADGALSEYVAIAAPGASKTIVIDKIEVYGNTVGTTIEVLDAAKKVANAVLPVQGAPMQLVTVPYVCTANGPLWITTSTASQLQVSILYHVIAP